MSVETVLITGSSGLIGSHLVENLLGRGCRVIGLSRSFPLGKLGFPRDVAGHYHEVEGDIRDSALLDEVFSRFRPSHLVHLAAQPIVGDALQSASSTFDVNIRGTWCVLEAARRYGALDAVVVASSDKAYGTHPTLPYREDFPLNAVWPYDMSKKITEQLAMSYFHSYGLPVSITRCGNVFGPYDLNLSRLVPGVIVAALGGECVKLRSSGQGRRCYVYAGDVAEAYFLILSAGPERVAGQAFNIGNEVAVPTLAMVRKILARLGNDMEIEVANTAHCEIDSQSLDCTRIRSVLGWEPRHALDGALDATIAWYASVHAEADLDWRR